MNDFTQFLETFLSRDREMKMQIEQQSIELIKRIKSELMLLSEQDQETGLEEIDQNLMRPEVQTNE
jgi:hypothetical protein